MRSSPSLSAPGAALLLALCACSAHDSTQWRGKSKAQNLPGYGPYEVDVGRYDSFADCERAMRAAAGPDADQMPTDVPKGLVPRAMHYLCVQDATEITVTTAYLIVDVATSQK